METGGQKAQVQRACGPLLSSCVHYSGAGESSPFFLLPVSGALEIAKAAAKPECEPEALRCHSPSFPPWSPSRAAGLGCGNAPPRRAASPRSWPRLLVLLGPALPRHLASPRLGWAAAPWRRQQDFSEGPGPSRLDKRGNHARPLHVPAPLVELGLRVTLASTRYVGPGGEPRGAGAGWAAGVRPDPWLPSPSALVGTGNSYPAHTAESLSGPARVSASAMSFTYCSWWKMSSVQAFMLSDAWLYTVCVLVAELLPCFYPRSLKFDVLVVKWWLTSICCGCSDAVAAHTFICWFLPQPWQQLITQSACIWQVNA